MGFSWGGPACDPMKKTPPLISTISGMGTSWAGAVAPRRRRRVMRVVGSFMGGGVESSVGLGVTTCAVRSTARAG